MTTATDQKVIFLDLTEEARVLVVEEAEPKAGIPVYVRECRDCGTRDMSDWYFGPDRDLGLGWTCPACETPDDYRWVETTLTSKHEAVQV